MFQEPSRLAIIQYTHATIIHARVSCSILTEVVCVCSLEAGGGGAMTGIVTVSSIEERRTIIL